MKLKDPLDGNCKHGIPKKEICPKCWKKRMKDSLKINKELLKNLNKAEKLGRKSKLQFD